MVTKKSCDLSEQQYTSFNNKEIEPVKPVQTKYQSNTYRTDVSWLHFDDEPTIETRLLNFF